MRASDIVTRAHRILSDTGGVRWTLPEMLDWIADAQRAVVFYRPDANAVNAVVRLVTGTRQSLPPLGDVLLRVVRNMGANGLTPGKAVRLLSREILDNEQPDWHTTPTAAAVDHYIYDTQDPKHFYVYPCVAGVLGNDANTHLEIVYAATPAAPTDTNDVLTLGDQYLTPVLDFALYRSYMKDAQYAGNMQRAQAHLQTFAAALDINIKQITGASMPQAASPAAAAAPLVARG